MSRGRGPLRSKSTVLRPFSTSRHVLFAYVIPGVCLFPIPQSGQSLFVTFDSPALFWPFSLHILVKYLTLDHLSRCPISFTVCSVLVVNFKLLSKVISVFFPRFLASYV